jgi:hypothetical protein
VNQLAEATTETVADLTERIGVSQLAEEHGNQLSPAAKALCAMLGIVLLDQRSELRAWKVLKELIEQTRDLYDGLAFLVGGV